MNSEMPATVRVAIVALLYYYRTGQIVPGINMDQLVAKLDDWLHDTARDDIRAMHLPRTTQHQPGQEVGE